ncbi:4-(cytidine 5'-diphospho)-2-C-methyl-D-erythritol kinase [Pseudophaeobacter leonis]|uniref:4-(cytidine 5'-diphospho)-2-C-methyl-D-erythritol kinase n=1 Tax=Pseudophaeobacter leonis TaxID=1144477 RepID=UPI0009F40918|nr:4-(cytidine 5'-diphospho)-2-C-methyl-D-erythritol kinase [Pseudophaeobacter leonis]
MGVEGFAPAKINLTLHVTGQRPDGYHMLDSLVVFADIGDRLRIEPAEDLSLTVTGPMAEGVPSDGRNLVLKAAQFAGFATGRVVLEKNLPAEAGIGGGSSDAAAMLRAVSQLTGAPVVAGAEALGADIPVCLAARATRMQNIGEQLSGVPELPVLHAILVNPGLSVPTPAVFKALAQKDNAAMPAEIPRFETASDMMLWLQAMRNDLEPAALSLHPGIGTVLEALAELPGASVVRMSGSGATCFALFAHGAEAEEAALRLEQKYPDWWVRPATLC